MGRETAYFVVLRRPESFEPEKLAETLMSILPGTRLDIALRLRRSWGLLHSTPEIAEAEKVGEHVSRAGFETFILPASEMIQSPPPRILKKAVPGPEGLTFQEGEEPRRLPWNHVLILGCGQVIDTSRKKRRLIGEARVARTLATTGLSMVSAVRISHRRIKGKTVDEKLTGTGYCLDLVTDDRADGVRIAGEAFDYACLGERKGYGVLNNFRLLYRDIARHLPDVRRNQGARAMDSGDVMKSRYADMDKYTREIHWLRQLETRP